MALTREAIRGGIIQKLIRDAGPWVNPLPEEEVRASRLAMMAARDPDEDIRKEAFELLWSEDPIRTERALAASRDHPDTTVRRNVRRTLLRVRVRKISAKVRSWLRTTKDSLPTR